MEKKRSVPLPVKLGERFRGSNLSSESYRLALVGNGITLTGLALTPGRVVRDTVAPPSHLAYDANKQLLYFLDTDLHSIDLQSGTSTTVARPPAERTPAPDALARATENLPPELRDDLRRPSFRWLLALSADGRELVTWVGGVGLNSVFMRLDANDGAVRHRHVVEGYSAGVEWAFERAWLCLPAHREGPRLLDGEGRLVSTLRRELIEFFNPPKFEPPFDSCAFRPGAPEIALGGFSAGLVLWRPMTGEAEVVDPLGWYPAWSRDGSHLWYLHGDHQLWTTSPGRGSPELVVELQGNEARPLVETGGSYAFKPVPSPCGRYTFAQLTRWRRPQGEPSQQNPFHADTAAFMVDAEAYVVHQASLRYQYDAVWVDVSKDWV